MGRFLYLVSAVLIAGFLICGCASSGSEKEERADEGAAAAGETAEATDGNALTADVDDAVTQMTKQWFDCLEVMEQLHHAEKWTFTYVKAFLDSGDWKDLMKARTACITAAKKTDSMKVPQYTVTDEQEQTLEEAGIDTGYLNYERESISIDISNTCTIIGDYCLNSLESDIFYKKDIEIMAEKIKFQEEYTNLLSRDICLMTNYMLLSLGDDKRASALWEQAIEDYPVIFNGHLEWMDSEDELKKADNEVLDELESLLSKEGDIQTVYEEGQSVKEGLMEETDMDVLEKEALKLENIPSILPKPSWFESTGSEFVCFSDGGEGQLLYPETGDELQDEPLKVSVKISGVSKEDITGYMEEIAPIVSDSYKSEDSDDWFIEMPDYTVSISLRDGSVIVIFDGADQTFVPRWYALVLD